MREAEKIGVNWKLQKIKKKYRKEIKKYPRKSLNNNQKIREMKEGKRDKRRRNMRKEGT